MLTIPRRQQADVKKKAVRRTVQVSVVIPTYNRALFIGQAVESVLQQTFEDHELIIVDDGSTDATPEVCSCYADRATILTTENRGPSAARNSGIRASRGEYVAFLDSDDLWLPEKLDRQMKFFRDNRDMKVCQTEEIWLRNGRRVNPKKKHAKYSGWIFEHCLPLCIVSPSAVMIHREVFEQVGVFDESMPACEDYDLWLRISAVYPIHLITDPLIIKRGGHPDQQSKTVACLDRLRIYALNKMLTSGVLPARQHRLAAQELKKKCAVYAGGCMKRGRKNEAEHYRKLAQSSLCP